MQPEISWHRPRGWLVCLVLALCAASTGAVLREPAANLTSDEVYRDCSDLPPYSPSGVYLLQPGLDGQSVPAYCDMDSDGGGWTVVIRRDDITPRQDFYQDWESYKWGIGLLDEEFYWGNEFLFQLTSHLDRRYQVLFWLEDFDDNTRHALYQNFVVESEAANYRLRVGEYSGDAGDSFNARNNNKSFSTYDRDNDEWSTGDCAEKDEAAWWFGYCSDSQLTGKYYEAGNSGFIEHGINWYTWKNTEPYSLKAALMKIKPSTKLETQHI